MSDRILGIAAVALAALYIWRGTLIEPSFMSDPLGPKAFPFIIGAVLAIAGIAVAVRPDEEPVWPSAARLLEIAMAVAIMVAYAWVLRDIGFVASTSVAAAYLSWRLGSHPVAAIIAGIVIAVGIFVVFKLILGLSLATGPWGF
jgi:putative tricarboxylic transport membrane protein